MTDHKNLAAALVAFQASLPRLRKTTSGQVPGKRDYKYADLADVNFDVLTELAKHGLCWICGPNRADDGAPVLRWKLLHTSGEFETGDYELPRDATPQQMGSAITYGRRYCVTAVTGVVPDGDDDGAAAATAQARPPQQRNAPQRQETAPTEPPMQTAAQRAAAAAGVILAAPTADAVETARKRVQKAPTDVQAVDVSGLVPANRRDALGIRSGEAVTLSQLADLKLCFLESIAENKNLVEASAS